MHCKWTVVIKLLVLAGFMIVLNGIVAPAECAGTPCCEIVAVNARTGVVTAKVNATGQEFEFKLSNPAQLKALRVNEAIYANLATKQVSLDGQHVVGQIISIASSKVAPVDGIGTQASPVDGVRSTGNQASRFAVSQIQGGYAFRNLSARFQSLLKNGEKLQVTFDNPATGKSTVTGVVTKISGGFQIETPERLNYQASGGWLLIRGFGNHGNGEPPCGGCPRDAHMDIFEGDSNVCYCFVSTGPGGGVVRPSANRQIASGCGNTSAK